MASSFVVPLARGVMSHPPAAAAAAGPIVARRSLAPSSRPSSSRAGPRFSRCAPSRGAARVRANGYGYGYGYGFKYGHGYGNAYGVPELSGGSAGPRPSVPPASSSSEKSEKTNGGSSSPILAALNAATNAFPLWVLLGAVVGMTAPSMVTWFKGTAITLALSVTMLGMGLTLELDDFLDAVKKPKQVALGVALQYTIMPTLGLVIGKLFPVARPVAVGLILVGCCPGGTASNLVTYLGRANVALSVVLTTASTFLACALTPLMTKTLAGTLVPVPASGLFASTLQVVLLPILGGLALKRWFPDAVKKVTPFCPPFAVATVALVCSSVIGSSSAAIASAGGALIAAVATLHACGFALGYGVACAFGFPEPDRRTVSIEVGMQNSALGVVLATAHFADPLVAVPCAISATVHSCLGSALAGTWRALDDGKNRA